MKEWELTDGEVVEQLFSWTYEIDTGEARRLEHAAQKKLWEWMCGPCEHVGAMSSHQRRSECGFCLLQLKEAMGEES